MSAVVPLAPRSVPVLVEGESLRSLVAQGLDEGEINLKTGEGIETRAVPSRRSPVTNIRPHLPRLLHLDVDAELCLRRLSARELPLGGAEEVELAELVIGANPHLEMVRFVSSGTEAEVEKLQDEIRQVRRNSVGLPRNRGIFSPLSVT